MKETQICGINLRKETVDGLTKRGIEVYDGEIGFPTRLTPSRGSIRCLLQNTYPENLHEYDIIIMDLTNDYEVEYVKADHTHLSVKNDKVSYIVCDYPQTIFDPRSLSLTLMTKEFKDFLEKGGLVIVFCAKDENISYRFEKDGHYEEFSLYDFLYGIPERENKSGKKTIVDQTEGELFNFLQKYNGKFSYETIFDIPKQNSSNAERYIFGLEYKPLIYNNEHRVVGFCSLTEKSGLFFLPIIEDQISFLDEFLHDIVPNYLPDLFPEIVKENWLKEERYHLPNQNRLEAEKKELEQNFKDAIANKKREIEQNKFSLSFLTDMLTKKDQELVNATIKFLKWLGFTTVKDGDSTNVKSKKEEDINIETEKGLIVIEVKGLGGTSKDSECSQIRKVIHRRQRERNSFDVYGHYIVNHQRHKAAEKRNNPPFSKDQIQDAEDDERGLITTWQLFNLYFAIEKTIISKADARSCFYETGLVDFIPKSMIAIGTPKEFFPKNSAIVIDLITEKNLAIGDKLMYVEEGEFKQVEIISIKVNDEPVNDVSSGEVGFKLDKPIGKNLQLYAYSSSKTNSLGI